MLHFCVLSETLGASSRLRICINNRPKKSLFVVLCGFLILFILFFFKIKSLVYNHFDNWWIILSLSVKGCLLTLGFMKTVQALSRGVVDPAKVAIAHPTMKVGCVKASRASSETPTTKPKHQPVWCHKWFSYVDDITNAQCEMRLCVRVCAQIP